MRPEKISIAEMLKKYNERRRMRRWQRQAERGMWYCVHCDKTHGKRVVEYNISEDRCVDSVCSIGMEKWIADSKNDPAGQVLEECDFYKFVLGAPCGRAALKEEGGGKQQC